MTDWFKDELFWRDNARFMFHQARLDGTGEEVEQLLKLCGLAPGAHVLDLPCGPGRHCLELTRRGLQVTGVDLTPQFLEEARNAAAREGLAIAFERADMREYRAPRPFDAVINMFTSFGYFLDRQDDRRVAENFFASLRPGGVLLLEMMGKEVLARVLAPRHFEREEDGTIFLQETEVLDDWSWVRSTWTIITKKKRVQHRLEHRVYSAVELRTLLESVGFTKVTCFGDLAGAPYNHEAQRLVVRATRPRG
ncbi:MAG: SAM-dependent methyltransferase [Phycisphaerales bacterium JB038]